MQLPKIEDLKRVVWRCGSTAAVAGDTQIIERNGKFDSWWAQAKNQRNYDGEKERPGGAEDARGPVFRSMEVCKGHND